jgi:gamma-glutamyl hercynylcysteine S-oxide synthase
MSSRRDQERVGVVDSSVSVPRGMLLIPAGEFVQGSPPDEGNPDERPARQVWLPDYAIDRLPVTNRLYAEFIEDGGYQKPELWEADGWLWAHWGGHRGPFWWWGEPEGGKSPIPAGPSFPDHPVVGLTWYEADAYARWAGKRLPSEAEWEKAARGVAGRRYPWGDDFDPSRANTREGGSGTLEPVGARPGGASPFGALDVAGNCFEWCADWYAPNAYQLAETRGSAPVETPPKGRKVCRGGAFDYPADGARCAHRAYYQAKWAAMIGFRCALSLTP